MSDCCSPSPAAPTAAAIRLACPRCARPGKNVSLLTLKHQVKPAHLAAVEAGPFALCTSPDCAAIYFNAAGTVLGLDDVRQVPTVKNHANPQLCYCFGFDTDMARAEISATGRCTIPDRIAAEMKAERCACEIRNPQGSCCFANVSTAVKRLTAAARENPASGRRM